MYLAFYCVFVVWSQFYVAAECPPIISKKEWDAIKPAHVTYLTTPVDLVVVLHTVTQSCSNDKTCAEVVRDLQKTHIEKSLLWDIGPSFLIGGNGKVYEGRGWNHVAIHTYGFNNQSLGIAFIGSFNNQEPSSKALESARLLIKCGVENNRLTEDHKVVAHKQLLPTESPGKKLASKIMSWPDWKDDVTDIKMRADKEEVPVTTVETEDKGPRPKDSSDKGMILASPKQIDLLTNVRDTVTELINNLREIALASVKTAEDFSKRINELASAFFENVTSGLKRLKDQFAASIGTIGMVPGVGKCVNPIKEKANALYDNTDAKARECADQRLKEVKEMLKNLGDLSTSTIDYTNTAVQQSQNCTELNLGIQSPSKACLDSIKSQTKSTTSTFQTQNTLALKSIQTSIDALPAALDLCAKKHLLEASSETAKLSSSVTSCPSKGLGGLVSNPFG